MSSALFSVYDKTLLSCNGKDPFLFIPLEKCNKILFVKLKSSPFSSSTLTQISGPPLSPPPPGSGGLPGVRAPRLVQGGATDAGPQRAAGPPLQQLGDRVDHQGAGRHAALRPAHPSGVSPHTSASRGRCGVQTLFNKLTTKIQPPALSERLLWDQAVPGVDY